MRESLEGARIFTHHGKLPPGLITLAPLAAADPAAVEQLLDAAFGTDRHGRTAYRLRTGVDAIAELSFSAFDDAGNLVGTLQSWPVELAGDDGRTVPLALVGPVAVRPDRQRDGIGRKLMEKMLAAADAGLADSLVLIGDPEYYGRFFGFDAQWTGGWEVPGPVERRRLLARLRGTAPLPLNGQLQARHAAPAAPR
ncbi:Predicted N-acetyltransferase YhbS [Sphingomonas laterariae]|uniref:Predicted N-acetyltransferase YhbS n=1 Tax=Edaphosphingomonas laterariae TaxID=861865 RepID=A0A239G6W1_9SPHN|nr:Predicted N-acetyltransferase YhbS [Sphingomonas laterariae]